MSQSPTSSSAVSPRPATHKDATTLLAWRIHLLSDPTRLRLLSILAAATPEPLSVYEVAQRLDRSQPATSHQLGKLMAAHLVEYQQGIGTVRHYYVCPNIIAETLHDITTYLESLSRLEGVTQELHKENGAS